MNSDISILIILLVGLIFSAMVSMVVIIELRRHAPKLGIIDEPDHRKIHKTPVARIGGLGIIAGFFSGVLFFQLARAYCGEVCSVLVMPNPYLLTGAIAIAVAGLADDLRGLNFRQKLVVQCLVATYMILAGARLNLNFFIYPGYAEAISVPLTFFWIIGVTNAVNLIDGLDGLAGGVFMISLLAITVCIQVSGQALNLVLIFCITGAVLGFLFLNWHPAKIFMGDSGSLFLGYVIACYSLQATEGPSSFFVFLVPIFAVGLPVFDTLLSMSRRLLKGHPMFYPDKDHIHHRIQRIFNFSQRKTVYALYGINICFGILAVLLRFTGNLMGFFVSVLGVAFLTFIVFRLQYLTPKNVKRFLKQRKQNRHNTSLILGTNTGAAKSNRAVSQ